MSQFDINRLNFGVVLTNIDAKLPEKSENNIGIDLNVIPDKEWEIVQERILYKAPPYLRPMFPSPEFKEQIQFELKPGERKLFSTGLKFNIPKGYALILKDRSGNANNKGLHVLGGVIDSSYKGEVKVIILNTSTSPVVFLTHDKICQAVVVRDYESNFVEITEEELTKSERGEKGFGSSGR